MNPIGARPDEGLGALRSTGFLGGAGEGWWPRRSDCRAWHVDLVEAALSEKVERSASAPPRREQPCFRQRRAPSVEASNRRQDAAKSFCVGRIHRAPAGPEMNRPTVYAKERGEHFPRQTAPPPNLENGITTRSLNADFFDDTAAVRPIGDGPTSLSGGLQRARRRIRRTVKAPWLRLPE